MNERGEEVQDLWERVFVDPERRQLAREFCEKISQINSVNVISSMPRRVEGGVVLPILYVLMSESYVHAESDQLMAYYEKVCDDEHKVELLSHVQVVDEQKFVVHKSEDIEYRYTPVTILWQRQKFPLNVTTMRNFNWSLN